MSDKKYRVKAHYLVLPHNLDRVELRSGVWNSTSIFIEDHEKKGKLYPIIESLNGENQSREISKQKEIPISQVEEVIDHMLNLGVLEDSKQGFLENFLSTYMPVFSYGKGMKVQMPILLMGDSLMTERLASKLKEVIPDEFIKIQNPQEAVYQDLQIMQPEDWLFDGISFFKTLEAYKDWKNHFVVLAFTNINPVFAKNFNRIAHELQISWMQIALDGPFLLIGPIFQNGESPCYECLEKRITMNLREHANYERYKKAIADRKISIKNIQVNPIILSLLISHGVIEIINFVTTNTSFTTRKILGIYLPTMEIAFNEVLALSSCQVCGPTHHRTDEQLYFDMQKQLESHSL